MRLLVDAVMRWSRLFGATCRLTKGEMGERFISMFQATPPKMTSKFDVATRSPNRGWGRSQ